MSPTANGNCEVLITLKPDGSTFIPAVEVIEDPQLEALKSAKTILNVENVELLSYLGFHESAHAYILRTIRAQIEAEKLSKLNYKFIPLDSCLGDKVQSEAKSFWDKLMGYVQEYMIWD